MRFSRSKRDWISTMQRTPGVSFCIKASAGETSPCPLRGDETEVAAGLGLDVFDDAREFVEAREQMFGLTIEGFAFRRERQTTPRAIEQLQLGLMLQKRDQAADRGLAEVQ